MVRHLVEADPRKVPAEGHIGTLAEEACTLVAHSLLREGPHTGQRRCQ